MSSRCQCCEINRRTKGYAFCDDCMNNGVSIFGKDVDYRTGKPKGKLKVKGIKIDPEHLDKVVKEEKFDPSMILGWYVLRGKKTGKLYSTYYDRENMWWLNVEYPMETDQPLKNCMMRVKNWRDCEIVEAPKWEADAEL